MTLSAAPEMSTSTAPPPAPRAGLRDRLLRAGGWVLAGHLLGQVLRLGGNLVLTRLLAPQDFGLMQVGYLVMTGLHLFSDMGLTQSVVRSPNGETPQFLRTAWTLHVVRGFILAGITLLFALGIHVFDELGWTRPDTVYNDPRLPWVVAAFAGMAILIGMVSMRSLLAERHLRQDLQARNELVCQVITLAVMVGVGWYTRSVAALVVGALLQAFIKLWMSHHWLPGPKDQWGIDRTALHEIVHFGKWVFGSSIIGFTAATADRILLGILVDAHDFGLYAVAFQLAGVLQTVGMMMGASLVFTALSEVHRERPHDMPRVLARLQWLYDAVIVTAAGFLTMAGPLLVRVLYDHRYDDAGWMLSALAVGVIGARTQVVDHLCNAIGQPRDNVVTTVLRLVAIVAAILGGFALFGLHGAVWGVALAPFLSWPMSLWLRHRHGMGVLRSEWVWLPAAGVGMLLGAGLIGLAGLVSGGRA